MRALNEVFDRMDADMDGLLKVGAITSHCAVSRLLCHVAMPRCFRFLALRLCLSTPHLLPPTSSPVPTLIVRRRTSSIFSSRFSRVQASASTRALLGGYAKNSRVSRCPARMLKVRRPSRSRSPIALSHHPQPYHCPRKSYSSKGRPSLGSTTLTHPPLTLIHHPHPQPSYCSGARADQAWVPRALPLDV